MNSIVQRRLHNQQLAAPSFLAAGEVVKWLGAMQAQDYAGAKWAIGLRMERAASPVNDAAVEEAFDAGAFLRTHVLRPTWHFVAPEDIRWLLALTAPRVHKLNAPYYRKVGLDDDLARRVRQVFTGALQGGAHRTREELAAALEDDGIPAGGELRMSYLLMRAELDGLLCSGPRRGRQFTYALLEERVPPSPPLTPEEALAELARRFFQSHGPATVHDLARWASLSLTEARRGLSAVSEELEVEEIDGQTYWFMSAPLTVVLEEPFAYLLSIYDEYVIGYKEWSAVVAPANAERLKALGNDLTAVLILNGCIAGVWKRTVGKRQVTVTVKPLDPLDAPAREAIAAAAQRYGSFLGLPAALAIV